LFELARMIGGCAAMATTLGQTSPVGVLLLQLAGHARQEMRLATRGRPFAKAYASASTTCGGTFTVSTHFQAAKIQTVISGTTLAQVVANSKHIFGRARVAKNWGLTRQVAKGGRSALSHERLFSGHSPQAILWRVDCDAGRRWMNGDMLAAANVFPRGSFPRAKPWRRFGSTL
jgi:hypothetical protein